MKNLKKILLLILLIIPVIVKADFFYTFDDSINKASNNIDSYINSEYYLDLKNNAYILNNGFFSDPRFIKAGYLNLSEYKIAGLKKSYLFDGSNYFMMPISNVNYTVSNDETGYSIITDYSIKNAIRTTEYIKKWTMVVGEGTRRNPWVFTEPVVPKIVLTASASSNIASAYINVTYSQAPIEHYYFGISSTGNCSGVVYEEDSDESHKFNNLTTGNYLVCTYVKDYLGSTSEVSSKPVSIIKPVIDFTIVPYGSTATATISLVSSPVDLSTYYFGITQAANCNSVSYTNQSTAVKQFTSLAVGTYRACVYAKDINGLASKVVTKTFEIKTVFADILTRNQIAYPDNKGRSNGGSPYVASNSGINFGAISSDTNGRGLFYTTDLSRTEDTNGDGVGERVYYFRGYVENNYAIFGGICWRIVRTVEDGSLRLRFGGYPSGNVCPRTGQNVYIARQVSFGNYNYNSSNAKIIVDNWYASYLNNKGASVTSKIADTPYCNDRNTYPSFAGANVTFGATHRVARLKQPSYKCIRWADKFTISSAKGNALLRYPAALLTWDEMSYAGGVYYLVTNMSYYLYTGQFYWSMSPFGVYSGNGWMAVIAGWKSGSDNRGGGLDYCNSNSTDDYVPYYLHMVPAISLNTNAKFVAGTGVYNNPYIIQ